MKKVRTVMDQSMRDQRKLDRLHQSFVRKPEEDLSKCDNCDWEGIPDVGLYEIPSLLERLDVGGIVPSGECPTCGSLCYEIDTPYLRVTNAERHLIEAASDLLTACERSVAVISLPCTNKEAKAITLALAAIRKVKEGA